MKLLTGMRVRLITPDNQRLNGKAATVESVTEWGAHVRTDAAATGKFRALFSEIEPVGAGQNSTPPQVTGGTNGHGYTGDVCQRCGSLRMVRNGTCTLCADCGESSGCS